MQAERDLVSRAQQDPEAFGQLYDLYYDRIFGYILHRTVDLDAAQDITSETFCKALKGLRTFQWRNLPFGAWLFRIASHEIATYYRKNGRVITVDIDVLESELPHTSRPDEEYLEAEAVLQQHTDFLTVQKALQQLPVAYQEVIALRFFENKQLNEIALIVDKKESTVKSLLYRGLAQLRASFVSDSPIHATISQL